MVVLTSKMLVKYNYNLFLQYIDIPGIFPDGGTCLTRPISIAIYH